MKKFLALILSLIMTLSFITGCGNSNNDVGTKAGDGATKKVSIDFWVADTATWLAGYQEIIKKFNETEPNIQIKLSSFAEDYQEKVKAAQAAKTPPDIYIEPVLANAATSGQFLDLTPYMEKDGFKPEEIYYQPYMDYFCKYEDKYYALPRDVFSLAFVYNKKLFDEAKVPYPQEGWTMDQMLETAKKLTNVEKKQYGIIVPEIWSAFPLMWAFGGDMCDQTATQATGTLNSPGTKEFFTFLQDLVFKYNVSPTPQQIESFGGSEAGGGSSTIFQLGKIAMMPVERYAVGDFVEAGLDLGAVSFPIGKDGKQWTYGSAPAWSISSSCKNPEEAWKFLKFAYGPEGSEILAKTKFFFPAVKGIPEKLGMDKDPVEKVFLQQLDTKNTTQLAFWWRRPADATGVWNPDILTPFEESWERILLQQEKVGDVLDQAAQTVDKNIADYKTQKGN